MEIDNFEQIKKLINPTSSEEFYLLQIIRRGKDQNSEYSNSYRSTVKSYYINSVDYLSRKEDEIKKLCNLLNARAYINLNKKSWKQVSLKSMEVLAQKIANDDFAGVKSIFDSACGKTGSCDGNKTWIVDVDSKNYDDVRDVLDVIIRCEPFDVEKVVDVIPTLNGYHIITKPFNKKTFRDYYNNQIDIHDNNPTLVYFNKKDE